MPTLGALTWGANVSALEMLTWGAGAWERLNTPGSVCASERKGWNLDDYPQWPGHTMESKANTQPE